MIGAIILRDPNFPNISVEVRILSLIEVFDLLCLIAFPLNIK